MVRVGNSLRYLWKCQQVLTLFKLVCICLGPRPVSEFLSRVYRRVKIPSADTGNSPLAARFLLHHNLLLMVFATTHEIEIGGLVLFHTQTIVSIH